MSTPREADLSKVRTIPVAGRPNKVSAGEFATPPQGDRSFAAFVRSLPDVLRPPTSAASWTRSCRRTAPGAPSS